MAGRPCAALATRRKRSPRATENRKGARARARASVDSASYTTSYGGIRRPFPDSLHMPRTHASLEIAVRAITPRCHMLEEEQAPRRTCSRLGLAGHGTHPAIRLRSSASSRLHEKTTRGRVGHPTEGTLLGEWTCLVGSLCIAPAGRESRRRKGEGASPDVGRRHLFQHDSTSPRERCARPILFTLLRHPRARRAPRRPRHAAR